MRARRALFLTLLLILAGCALLPPLIGIKEVSVMQTLYVDSYPSGADIFLNDRLVGRAPCEVPLVIKLDTASYWPKEQQVLRASKEGFTDAAQSVEFKQGANIFDDSYKYFPGPEIAPNTKVKLRYTLVLKQQPSSP